MKRPFETCPLEVRRFYAMVFNTAVINLYAVNNGHFDKLISDMDDFYDITKWYNIYPSILNLIQKDNERQRDGY